jgi:hypothetical protein
MPHHPLSCSQAQAALAEIDSLATAFDEAYEEAVKTRNLSQARTLLTELELKVATLREGLVSPLERELNLKEQYASQRDILAKNGMLERLPSGEQGITGIDGKKYPIPSYEVIRGVMQEKRGMLEKKASQGFTKLLLVPFGMELDDMKGRYGAALVRHHTEGKLFAAKEKDSDPDVPLPLDTNTPVWAWDQYASADVNGKLVYDPKEFSANHGGRTKTELLQEGKAWRVSFVESDPIIPREGRGKEIGGRKQIEANQTPRDYLRATGNGIQDHESGTTPEDWLIEAMTLLEEKNQVLDDYQGNGSVSYQTGAYFSGSGNVPSAYWSRGVQRARLGRSDPTPRDVNFGARSAVRV